MNKGALALLIHGGTENWSPERLEGPVRRGVQRPARRAVARYGIRPGRNPIRRGLEAGAGRACGIHEPAGDFQPRRRRRRADGGQQPAESAPGSRRGLRPHVSNDGICRASRADASSPGALSEGQPAREALGAKGPMAGERDFGRDHGPRHAWGERRRGAQASRLSRGGLEPKPQADRRHRLLSRRGRVRCVSASRPISWSACCR